MKDHQHEDTRSASIPTRPTKGDNDDQSKSKKKPDQIGYYSGDTRAILERAKSLVRIYLATVDLFPDPEDSKNIAISIFDESCRDVLGRRSKSKSPPFFQFKLQGDL